MTPATLLPARRTGVAALFAALLVLAGCASHPPMPTVEKVDLPRFMGPWYVIAAIPTFIETEAYNAIESYELAPDGTIATTFTFRKGAFDGPLKVHHPRGFVQDTTTNATWGMQFIWPIKAEFLITHLDEGYTRTIIGRSARDYVWIMARTPTIPEPEYQALVDKLKGQGYDVSKLRRVPQQWPTPVAGTSFTGVVDAAGLQATKVAGAPPLVLDVRSPEEFAAGHVPGAKNLPHGTVLSNPAAIAALGAKPDTPVVLYCRSGKRANLAAAALRAAGYTDLRHLEGDMPGWEAAGQTVER